ncbi:MATE family efflux transporter [Sphaerochaeta sp. PS]|uniref:MATE family efflux transporter n=1 Tax=Sphaerochaeta sp. PS TaxID=3076336 RepID=UPI0028A3D503|nr:MATE family efflux transporter [Sphaerochaeta sp. PS]MDT4762436.1 MATE family efflux transporter [Sphaerochaeta sp. PS]
MKPQLDNRKEFSRRMLSIALPVVFQGLLTNSLSFVDTLMIGQLGEQAIAAVGLANQMFFLISLLFFGISSGSSIFMSQYWGAGNEKNIKRVIALSVTIAFLGAGLASIASFFIPTQLMHIFTYDKVVVDFGVTYLKIVAVSYVFSAISQVFSTALRVIGKAKTPLWVALFSLSLNALGNYFLIFGVGPFPVLGVAGAAIATAVSRLAEVVLLIIITYAKHPVLAIKDTSAFRWDRKFLALIIPTSLPVLLNEIFWALGMTTYKIAFSKMGISALAAVNVTESIGNLFFVAMMGVSNATLIMIGIKIGEGRNDLARLYAKRFILIALVVGIGAGLLEATLAPWFANLFNIGEEVRRMAVFCLFANAMLLPIKSINMAVIVGILRAGGDTRFSMFAEMFGVWAVGVPLAFIGALVLHLSIWQLYLLLGMEEATKLCIGLVRVKKDSWITDLTAVH